MSDSIRDRVKKIQVELRDQDVLPARARELLMELTGLYGHVVAEVTQAEIEYAAIHHAAYQREETANRAEIAAKDTPEYKRRLEAKATLQVVSKMMSSCRSLLDSLNTEMRLSR